MRILHTSDWHIGKKLESRSRYNEQQAVLKNLTNIVREKQVDIVVVAGDIFDTFLPSAESEKLFYEVLSEITSAKAQVIIISGNHDDPTRLSAAKSVAENGGVYFADNEYNAKRSYLKTENNANLIASGKDYFIFEKNGEKLCFSALPYPTELRMKEKLYEDETYEDKVKRYINSSVEHSEGLPVILIGHIFMLGGESTEGERAIDLGGARILPPSIIPECCIYTALGHLHKRQIVSKERNILYSGSIMPYSFDESMMEKSVTVFDVIEGKVQNLEVIKLSGYKELFRISAHSLEEAEKIIEQLDGYIELTLMLDKPIPGTGIKEFISKHPEVVLKTLITGVESAVFGRKTLNDKELLTEYYKSQFGAEPSQEVMQLYLSLLNVIGVDDEA